MNAHVAISRATTVATSSARVSSASARRRNPGKITSAASVASRCVKRVAFAGGARRRGDLTLTRVSPEEQQEAYNRAMAEYSKTPFEYRHDLGLCACPTVPSLPLAASRAIRSMYSSPIAPPAPARPTIVPASPRAARARFPRSRRPRTRATTRPTNPTRALDPRASFEAHRT